jgi:hypothetical protein
MQPNHIRPSLTLLTVRYQLHKTYGHLTHVRHVTAVLPLLFIQPLYLDQWTYHLYLAPVKLLKCLSPEEKMENTRLNCNRIINAYV